MATFLKIEAPTEYFNNRLVLKVNGKITEDDVKKINSFQNKTTLVLSSTKGQSSSIISSIKNPNVNFSVVGGLDYFNKNKFRSSNYIKRTLYSPNVLASIINCFENIERHIRYTWSERQKCMYVYKTLAEHLHYKYDHEDDYENGRDVVRSLEGLLYGKLVCSGFALVFKEAMDRLGIPCIYQNRRGHHSWNIVKLDGKQYGMELTWDCFGKGKDNTCGFHYFGRNADFYSNKHHDISNEPEERRQTLSAFSIDELKNDYNIIANSKNVEKRKMFALPGGGGKAFIFPISNASNGIYPYLLAVNNNHIVIYSDKPFDKISATDVYNAINNNERNYRMYLKNTNKKIESYKRNDGTQFHICKNGGACEGIDEYFYYDVVYKNGEPYFRRGVLLSEMDLTHPVDWDQKQQIANNLLSHERLKRKINSNHGYVGYISDRQVYYNRQFEEKELLVAEHK